MVVVFLLAVVAVVATLIVPCRFGQVHTGHHHLVMLEGVVHTLLARGRKWCVRIVSTVMVAIIAVVVVFLVVFYVIMSSMLNIAIRGGNQP
jgi:hypothetical protein